MKQLSLSRISIGIYQRLQNQQTASYLQSREGKECTNHYRISVSSLHGFL